MLSDFGTITTRDNDLTKRRNTMCGTILYLAPESLQGGNVTAAVDIWSIGCITYLLYTGCFLFEGENELNVIDSIEHFCVDMLDFPDYIPADAIDLIKRMLQYDPQKRITTREIKSHPFFQGIDFATLPTQRPPYVPPFVPLPVIFDDVGARGRWDVGAGDGAERSARQHRRELSAGAGGEEGGDHEAAAGGRDVLAVEHRDPQEQRGVEEAAVGADVHAETPHSRCAGHHDQGGIGAESAREGRSLPHGVSFSCEIS